MGGRGFDGTGIHEVRDCEVHWFQDVGVNGRRQRDGRKGDITHMRVDELGEIVNGDIRML